MKTFKNWQAPQNCNCLCLKTQDLSWTQYPKDVRVFSTLLGYLHFASFSPILSFTFLCLNDRSQNHCHPSYQASLAPSRACGMISILMIQPISLQVLTPHLGNCIKASFSWPGTASPSTCSSSVYSLASKCQLKVYCLI